MIAAPIARADAPRLPLARVPGRRPRAARPSGVRGVPPSGAMATMTAALLELDRALTRAITEEVRAAAPELLEEPRADADGPVTGPAGGVALPDGAFRLLLRRLRSLLGGVSLLARRAARVLERVFGAVARHSEHEWTRQLASLGIQLDDVAAPNFAFLRQLWRRRNLDLIKRLCETKIARVERVLLANRGARVQTLARRIQAATGTGAGHARLLARDQTLKLYGQIQQARHQSAGVTEYVWRSSRDERVRLTHKALDGTRHRYADPPIVDPKTGRRAHPGDDYQCRCTADPVLPGID